MLPFALVPEEVAVVAIIVLGLVGTLWAIRRLGLPFWWLAFPPFVDGLYNANPHVLLVPLLVAGAAPIAVMVKLYAGLVPLGACCERACRAPERRAGRGRRRHSCHGPSTSPPGRRSWTALREQSDGGMSAIATPLLIPVAIAALVLMGRKRAAWWIVPVLWPSTQWYYASMVMPAATLLAAVVVAVPSPWSTTVAAALVAGDVVYRRRRPETGRPADPWRWRRDGASRRTTRRFDRWGCHPRPRADTCRDGPDAAAALPGRLRDGAGPDALRRRRASVRTRPSGCSSWRSSSGLLASWLGSIVLRDRDRGAFLGLLVVVLVLYGDRLAILAARGSRGARARARGPHRRDRAWPLPLVAHDPRHDRRRRRVAHRHRDQGGPDRCGGCDGRGSRPRAAGPSIGGPRVADRRRAGHLPDHARLPRPARPARRSVRGGRRGPSSGSWRRAGSTSRRRAGPTTCSPS